MRRRVPGWLYATLLLVPAAYAAEYEGSLEWSRQVSLGTLASGVVEKVNVQVGDRVQKGQLLARLDQRALVASVKRAEAQAAYLRSAFDESARELERTQELYDRTLLADHDLQLAQIAQAKAGAGLRAAEAELIEAQMLLDYSAVRAPFDGVVLSREAEPGQVVVTRLESVTLFTVAATDEMLARVELPLAQSSAVKAGQRATIRIDGKSVAGSVRQVLRRPGETAAFVDVVFAPPAAASPAAGQRVQVVLP